MAFDFRTPMLAAALVVGIGCATTVVAETSTTVDPREVQQAAVEDPKVCKRITPTGSRIARRICFKQSEWDAMREGGQRAARDAATEESQYGYRGIGPGGTNPY